MDIRYAKMNRNGIARVVDRLGLSEVPVFDLQEYERLNELDERKRSGLSEAELEQWTDLDRREKLRHIFDDYESGALDFLMGVDIEHLSPEGLMDLIDLEWKRRGKD